jgi:hypothetical protein
MASRFGVGDQGDDRDFKPVCMVDRDLALAGGQLVGNY